MKWRSIFFSISVAYEMGSLRIGAIRFFSVNSLTTRVCVSLSCSKSFMVIPLVCFFSLPTISQRRPAVRYAMETKARTSCSSILFSIMFKICSRLIGNGTGFFGPVISSSISIFVAAPQLSAFCLDCVIRHI